VDRIRTVWSSIEWILGIDHEVVRQLARDWEREQTLIASYRFKKKRKWFSLENDIEWDSVGIRQY
jgi:hypothetical protein